MKNASLREGGGGGGVALKRRWGMVGCPGPDKISPFHPPFQTECF